MSMTEVAQLEREVAWLQAQRAELRSFCAALLNQYGDDQQWNALQSISKGSDAWLLQQMAETLENEARLWSGGPLCVVTRDYVNAQLRLAAFQLRKKAASLD